MYGLISGICSLKLIRWFTISNWNCRD